MNSQDLKRLTNGLTLLENIEQVNTLDRLKGNVPFSQQLNDWIKDWYKANSNKFIFTDTDDFDENDIEGTFKKHVERYKLTRKIHIWTGASDNTIFGNPTVNHMFRAWHDYHHIVDGFGYDFINESIVADIQKSQLPKEWLFERELIHIEVVGQAQSLSIHGDFVKDQRLFTTQYLSNPQTIFKYKY